MKKMPVLFVGHGSPMNAIEDNTYSREWISLGQTLEKPKAILSISAHWFARGTKVNDSLQPAMIYDMYGFPNELYQLKYPVAGSSELAYRVRDLVGDVVSIDNNWGIDHGSWSVLHRMFPNADVPVVQLSVNTALSPEEHFAIGRKLQPLREEGILIIGSGNIVHNLARVDWRMNDGQLWAQEFDQYIYRAILNGKYTDVINFAQAGESASLSVPSMDHFAPLLYILGVKDENDSVRVFNDECTLGSMSMTSYLFTQKS